MGEAEGEWGDEEMASPKMASPHGIQLTPINTTTKVTPARVLAVNNTSSRSESSRLIQAARSFKPNEPAA
jgi:hypothetical protein